MMISKHRTTINHRVTQPREHVLWWAVNSVWTEHLVANENVSGSNPLLPVAPTS